MTEHLVVVGAGQAATQAAQTLRQQNYAGAITLLGEEPYAPYQRPPPSKKSLGETPRERPPPRPQAFYAEKTIALEVGTRVKQSIGAAHALRLHDGRTLRRQAAVRDR
jgi:3-phenylpropionate/trans-cinnamate dioxygenase ferredoxin reductase subunit